MKITPESNETKKRKWSFHIPKNLPTGEAAITWKDNKPFILKGVYCHQGDKKKLIVAFCMDKGWPRRQSWDGPLLPQTIYTQMQRITFARYHAELRTRKNSFITAVRTDRGCNKSPHYRFELKRYESRKKRAEILLGQNIFYKQGQVIIGPEGENQESFDCLEDAVETYQNLIIKIMTEEFFGTNNSERKTLYEIAAKLTDLYRLVQKRGGEKSEEATAKALTFINELISKYAADYNDFIAAKIKKTIQPDKRDFKCLVPRIKTTLMLIECRDHAINPEYDEGRDTFLQYLHTITSVLEFELKWMRCQLRNACALIKQTLAKPDECLLLNKADADSRLEQARIFACSLEANPFYSPALTARSHLQASRVSLRRQNVISFRESLNRSLYSLIPLF